MKAVLAQAESCCVYVKPKKCMQNIHDIIPYVFYCWANPVVHRLLLKSSMLSLMKLIIARQATSYKYPSKVPYIILFTLSKCTPPSNPFIPLDVKFQVEISMCKRLYVLTFLSPVSKANTLFVPEQRVDKFFPQSCLHNILIILSRQIYSAV